MEKIDEITCYGGVFPEENVIQVVNSVEPSGSEEEDIPLRRYNKEEDIPLRRYNKEDEDIPLRRGNKALSLATGLNRLHDGEDQPDGEGTSTGRISFLHSKYAHSTFNLSEVGSSEAEEKKKNQQKKKSNRISRVIEEFISMGDAISYADKRISKSFASLTPDEGHKQEDRMAMVDTRDNIIVVDPEDSPELSDAEIQLRRRKPGSKDQLDIPRSSLSNSKDHLEGLNDKERERRKTHTEKRESRRVSQVVHPFQPSITTSSSTSTPTEEVPALPSGKTTLDVNINLGVDKVFELCYSDSEFYRNWMFDPRRPGEPKKINVPDWRLNEESGLKEREIIFELFQDFVITKATITSSMKQSLSAWSRPGSVYGVEVKVTNKGPPLADSFVLTEHHRLTATGDNSCQLVKVAKVDFLKYSLLKGKIESETWAGIAKAEEILEERFHDIDQTSNMGGNKGMNNVQEKSSKPKTKTKNKIPSINFYPENWKWTGQIILAIILLILILVVISLFKMVSTLDNIDTRLHNIENILNLS